MNEKMIHSIAGKLFSQYVADTEHEARLTHEDLIHAGVLGWLEAEQRLDKEQEEYSGSYFYLNVQGRMMDLIRKQALVRMPQIPYTRLKELMAVRKEMERTDEVITDVMLAEKLNWKVQEVRELLANVPHVFSADRVYGDEGEDSGSFYDTLITEDQPKQPQVNKVLKNEIAELIQHCLSRLENARMRMILAARYLEDIKLQDLADRFGCTAQTVHYQEKKGLKEMRSCLEKNGWQWDGDDIE